MFDDINQLIEWGEAWGTHFNLLLLAALYFLTRRWLEDYGMPFTRYLLTIAVILIFFEFSFWGGDWFHYYDYLLGRTDMYLGAMEDFYYDVADFVNGDYLVWRLCVWGSVLALSLATAKRLGIDQGRFLAFYAICCVLILSYARASLAMSIAFFGYSFIIKPLSDRGKWASYALGTVIILQTPLFHRSSLILFPIFVLTLIPFTKQVLKTTLFVVPVCFLILNVTGIASIVDYVLSGDDKIQTLERFNSYASGDVTSEGGPIEMLTSFLQYASYVYVCYFVIRSVMNQSYEKWSDETKQLSKLIFWTICIAFAFLLSANIATSVFFYRIIYFSIIPIALFLSIHSEEEEYERNIKVAYRLFAIFAFVSLTKWATVPVISFIYHTIA